MKFDLLVDQLILLRDELHRSGRRDSTVSFGETFDLQQCLLIVPANYEDCDTLPLHQLGGHKNIQSDYENNCIEITLGKP